MLKQLILLVHTTEPIVGQSTVTTKSTSRPLSPEVLCAKFEDNQTSSSWQIGSQNVHADRRKTPCLSSMEKT